MTKAELLEQLKDVPDDWEVYLYSDDIPEPNKVIEVLFYEEQKQVILFDF